MVDAEEDGPRGGHPIHPDDRDVLEEEPQPETANYPN
jgi:hypothetical protein